MNIIKNFYEVWRPFSTLKDGTLFKQGSGPKIDVCFKLPQTVKTVENDRTFNAYNLDKNTFCFVGPDDNIVVPLKGTLTVEPNFIIERTEEAI